MSATPATTASPTGTRKRLLGLDALRGIAVFLMIEQHLGVWLWRGLDPGQTMTGDHLGLLIFNALGGGAAPAFVTLAGIGSSLLVHKRAATGAALDLTLAKRGLAVIGFGYLLSFLTPSWFSVHTWFVLHLMGFGMLLTPALRRLPSAALLGLGLAVLLLTGWVQATLDVPISLTNEYMRGRHPSSPTEWTGLRIAVAEGQFPIFPWFSFFLAGLVCGRWVAQEQLGRIASLAGGVGVVGALGLLVGELAFAPAGGALWRTTTLRIPFFPASPTLVALLLAAVLLGIWAVMAWERRWPLRENNPLVTLGRASLTLLILHVWLFREATRPIGVWQALDVAPAMLVLFGFVALAALASWQWQRVGYRFGAEWLLRKLAP
ncbi:DUF418 domain-containing transporter [Enhygromyxa salina]|uniref:Acyltransferase family protein n=1 Tax=Enhygromyxa salina TaxID=215803 RepID=A0A2S9XU93_9BACT|nr:DUF418 domain-containing transporter [Enhygromyxa salina]PRP96449.1 Acyltransferase family protein [Enhygromyxa salina]